eukprot:Gregarina_sp_Poly_1__4225@NODE_2303_length_2328_cov_174_498452_g1476_i0_p2_GENE_NODE_2303_length_2328_cov_174_498452_g1476_i0NODE_2303_length_2328_cov_174_498452_g1476_i0_p2_ORF_typecomplete_len294_score31_02_NODE_2303_length_2328_cov_174_498452_g1476_i013872268
MSWSVISGLKALFFSVVVVEAFRYQPLSVQEREPEWDIWRIKRDVLVDCRRSEYVPEFEGEFGMSVELCEDVCEVVCQDPKTLADMAQCLGRMNLLQCRFGYSELKEIGSFGHWCMDRFKHLHIYMNDSALVTSVREESLFTKMYIRIDPSLDKTCRDGSGMIMDIIAPEPGETWPTSFEGINCSDPLWDNPKRTTFPGHRVTVQHSISHSNRIMFPLRQGVLDELIAQNGSVHFDFSFAACYQGGLQPPTEGDGSWAGIVLQVPREIVSFRSLYDRNRDVDFWRWKGPFVKW